MSSAAQKKRGLGMGLAALLGEPDSASSGAGPSTAMGMRMVPIELLTPSPLQPRHLFDEAELEALAQSLRQKGVLQPLVVRPRGEGGYEIVAGERRWRAAQKASIHELPAIIRQLTDAEVLELALVENLQRQDLGPLEEAVAYRRLIDEFGNGQEEVAEIVGKSRSHVANTLRLLALPEEVRAMVEDGRLTAGHARALLAASDPVAFAALVVDRDLNVRQTEALVKRPAPPKTPAGHKARSPDLGETEERLARSLGLAVSIQPRRRGGVLTIRYGDLDQLESLMEKLTFSG